MTLADMIRKRRALQHANANANYANYATEGAPGTKPLATLAALALANLPVPETASPTEQLVDEEKRFVYRWWRIHYADRHGVEAVYAPPATHEEVLKWNPNSIKVEPFKPIRRKPTEPLSALQEAKIKGWLTHIGEIGESNIKEVIEQCNTDADARTSYLEAAEKVVVAEGG